MVQLDISHFIAQSIDKLINEGVLAEINAGTELISGQPSHFRPEMYYWHREAHASNAEVDYVMARRGRIVPIEVKSSGRGAMKSMRVFLDDRPGMRGTRLSHENFGTNGRIDIVPLYADCLLADMLLESAGKATH